MKSGGTTVTHTATQHVATILPVCLPVGLAYAPCRELINVTLRARMFERKRRPFAPLFTVVHGVGSNVSKSGSRCGVAWPRCMALKVCWCGRVRSCEPAHRRDGLVGSGVAFLPPPTISSTSSRLFGRLLTEGVRRTQGTARAGWGFLVLVLASIQSHLSKATVGNTRSA